MGKSLNHSVLLSGQEKDNGSVPRLVCSVLVLPLLLTMAVGQMWIGFGLQRNKKE